MTKPFRFFSSPSRPARPRPLRQVLLGAAAALTSSGSLGATAFLAPAYAQSVSHSQAAQAAPVTVPGSIPSFADVIDRVKGAVVSVRVRVGDSAEDSEGVGMPGLQPGDPLERFFRRFGENGAPGTRRGGPCRQAMAQGSGFIISGDGFVVTNNHVVKNAREVILGLDDGRSLQAKVVGTD